MAFHLDDSSFCTFHKNYRLYGTLVISTARATPGPKAYHHGNNPKVLWSHLTLPPFSKLFSNGEDGIGFKRMRFSEDSEMTQRWRVSFVSVSEDVKMVVTFGRC